MGATPNEDKARKNAKHGGYFTRTSNSNLLSRDAIRLTRSKVLYYRLIVSENGFSKGALRLAKQHHIEAFTVAETERNSWEVKLAATIIIEHWVLTPLLFRFMHQNGHSQDILDDRELQLIDNPSGQEIVPAALIQKMWNDLREKKAGEQYFRSLPVQDHPSIKEFIIGFSADVQKYLRPASLQLIGLTSAETRLTYARDFMLTTENATSDFSPRPCFTALLRTTKVRTVMGEPVDFGDNSVSFRFSTKKPWTFDFNGTSKASSPIVKTDI